MHLQVKKCQRLPANNQMLEGDMQQTLSHGLQKEPTHWHLDLKISASRSVKQQISVAQATQFVVLCYGSPSKLIYYPTQRNHSGGTCPANLPWTVLGLTKSPLPERDMSKCVQGKVSYLVCVYVYTCICVCSIFMYLCIYIHIHVYLCMNVHANIFNILNIEFSNI